MEPKPHIRWYQFSIRTLLVLLSGTAILAAIWRVYPLLAAFLIPVLLQVVANQMIVEHFRKPAPVVRTRIEDDPPATH